VTKDISLERSRSTSQSAIAPHLVISSRARRALSPALSLPRMFAKQSHRPVETKNLRSLRPKGAARREAFFFPLRERCWWGKGSVLSTEVFFFFLRVRVESRSQERNRRERDGQGAKEHLKFLTLFLFLLFFSFFFLFFLHNTTLFSLFALVSLLLPKSL